MGLLYLYNYSFVVVAVVKLSAATGHRMVADGSVGSGSNVTGFPFAKMGSATFLAWTGIFHVVFVFGLSLQIRSGYSFRYEIVVMLSPVNHKGLHQSSMRRVPYVC